MDKNKGLYLGTEIDEKWWRRYAKDKLLMRGNGEYWHDDKGFYFLRHLTKEPIFIPFGAIVEIKLGQWHSGRWAYGNFIVKIVWQKDNIKLSSGFIVSKNREDAIKVKEILQGKIKLKKFCPACVIRHITADKREIKDFLKLPSATSFIHKC